MEGHRYLKKAIIRKLSIDYKTKQGPYYLRRVHVFYKNECILEVDVTGYIHAINPLANIGDISFHVDAGSDLVSLAPRPKKIKRKKKK